MRKYTFVYTSGKEKDFLAEEDSLHPGGAVVLSKKSEVGKGIVLNTGKKIEIVRVISLANVEDYGYVEIND